jgi:hypothetical protein
MSTMDIKVTFYDIVWNNKYYYNNRFEVYGKYEVYGEEHFVDIESLNELQEKVCNEDEKRSDLVITNYEYKIEEIK